jgi:transposase
VGAPREVANALLNGVSGGRDQWFVDWAGDKLPIYDRHGGLVWYASVFVASLGASSYTYAEATADQQLASWIGAHVRTFA